ncbi:MAG: hypothetical protein ACPHRO_08710, partial [Nannocystaceae bacterium]
MQFGQPQEPTPTSERSEQQFAPGMYGDPRAGHPDAVSQDPSYVALFGPLVYVWILGSKLPTMTPKSATIAFLVYSGLIGVMMAPLVAMYIANAPNTLIACFLGT